MVPSPRPRFSSLVFSFFLAATILSLGLVASQHVHPSSTFATLPTTCTDGAQVVLTDNIRGLWACKSNKWHSVTGSANPLDFGADDTGVASSTQALRDAIAAATAVGAPVDVPVGTFLLTDVGQPELLLFTDGILFRGSGKATVFNVAAAVGATIDIFHVQQTTRSMYIFEDFKVKAVSGAPGRHVFNLDCNVPGGTTAGNGPQFVTIRRIDQTVSDFGGYFVATTGTVSSTNYIVSLVIEGNGIGSGIDLGSSETNGHLTDIARISDNWFYHTSDTKGIKIRQQAGSAGVWFTHNHVVIGGGITLINCFEPHILYNNMEQTVNLDHTSQPNGAMLEIYATTEEFGGEIIGNNFSVNPAMDDPTTVDYGILIGLSGTADVREMRIEGNIISVADGGTGIYLGTHAENPIIGRNYIAAIAGATINPLNATYAQSPVYLGNNNTNTATASSLATIQVIQPADDQYGLVVASKSATCSTDIVRFTNASGGVYYGLTCAGLSQMHTGAQIGGSGGTVNGTAILGLRWGAEANVPDGGAITHGLGATPTACRVTGTVAGEMPTVPVASIGATVFNVDIKKPNPSGSGVVAGTAQTIMWECVK